MLKRILFIAFVFVSTSLIHAHDTWIEAGPLVQPAGEYTYVNLMLGNHGNDHRDFKLASKITLAPCTLSAITPSGAQLDLKPAITDMGNAEKEGYWTARCELSEAGVYQFLHTLDTLHGKIRAIKSSKTYVVAMDGLGSEKTTGMTRSLNQPLETLDHDEPLGLELVLKTPLGQIAAGSEIHLQVLRAGKPLGDARVTFVPRGTTLAAGFDPEHERKSDAQGMVSYVPGTGSMLLAVVHHVVPEESGPNFDRTHYAATLVLPVRNQPVLARSR